MPPATAASKASGYVALFRRRGQFGAVHGQHRLVGGDHRLAGRERGFHQGAGRAVGAADQLQHHVHVRIGRQRHRVFIPAQPGQRDAAVLGAVARGNGGHGDRTSGTGGDQVGIVAQQRQHAGADGAQAGNGDGQGMVAHACDPGWLGIGARSCGEAGQAKMADHSSDLGGVLNRRGWPVRFRRRSNPAPVPVRRRTEASAGRLRTGCGFGMTRPVAGFGICLGSRTRLVRRRSASGPRFRSGRCPARAARPPVLPPSAPGADGSIRERPQPAAPGRRRAGAPADAAESDRAGRGRGRPWR